jgi:hypothetical protein
MTSRRRCFKYFIVVQPFVRKFSCKRSFAHSETASRVFHEHPSMRKQDEIAFATLVRNWLMPPSLSARAAVLRHGWTVGRNVQFDRRQTLGDAERARRLAVELISLMPDGGIEILERA